MSRDENLADLDLPQPLPPGERVLWQGRPRWQSLAVHGYHLRKVSAYLALMVAVRGIELATDPAASTATAARGTATAALLALTAIGLIALLAYLSARAALFTLTSRRVLLRHGVALSMTLNLPLRTLESADLAQHRDGTGSIALRLPPAERVGYLLNWPFVRPSRLAHPEPLLRDLPDAPRLAGLLAGALSATLSVRESSAASESTGPAAVPGAFGLTTA
ncbi:MAG: PH domain-containing protein [Proteobacteria bacterium]|nr:PH domain-containing protein [Pseudomonadota bacterium]